MLASEYNPGRMFVGRVGYGDDLTESVQKFCDDNGIAAATFSAIGAVMNANVGYYKQVEKQYSTFRFDEHLEIISCIGNISLRDGKPFLHAHVALSDIAGQTRSGHLMPGTTVFACEFTLQEIIGPEIIREHDDTTGLWLWQKL